MRHKINLYFAILIHYKLISLRILSITFSTLFQLNLNYTTSSEKEMGRVVIRHKIINGFTDWQNAVVSERALYPR